jgi:hypothetical protein
LDSPVVGFSPLHAAVQNKAFRDLCANRENRVEGSHRLLENHGYPITSDLPDFAICEPQQVDPLEQDLT